MITITVETDNAAFEDGDELSRVLARVAASVARECGDSDAAHLTRHAGGRVLDTNGNTVARWENVPE